MSYATLKANQLRSKADSKFKSKISIGNKYKDAAKLYEEAGDLYEEDNQYGDAAQCYLGLAQCYLQLKKPLEAAEAYADAAMNFNNERKTAEAIANYELACQMLAEQGRFVKAAEIHLDLADIFEKEHKLKQAVPHVHKAVDYFESEQKLATLKKTKERLASLNSLAGYYDDAIEYYESVANSILKDGTDSKLKAREYLFKAGLCQLAQVKDPEEDLEMAEDKIKEYKDMDKYFQKSAGLRLLNGIMDAFDEKSIALYQKALREYDDNDAEMDTWMTAILEVIYTNVKFVSDEANDLT